MKPDVLNRLANDAKAALKKIGTIVGAAVNDGRELTEDEQSEVDALQAKVDEIDARIDATKANAKIATVASGRLKSYETVIPTATTGGEPETPNDTGGIKPVVVPAVAKRYKPLRAFKGPNAEADAYASGQWFKATQLKNESAIQWCRDHGVIANIHKEGDNSKGGHLVPGQMSSAIIDLREEYGVFRRLCGTTPMSSDTLEIPRRTGGLTAYFTGEGAEYTESEKGWDKIGLSAKKATVFSRMSNELAEDAIINIADDLASEMAYALALKEDQCGFLGDGTSTYGGMQGICTKFEADANLAGHFAAPSNIDTFEELTDTHISQLIAKLPRYAMMQQPRFFVSQYGWGAGMARLLFGAGGNAVADLQGGSQYRYHGFPVEIVNVMQGSGDGSDKVMILFGVLPLAAKLGSRRELTFSTTTDRYWELGQIGVKCDERFDINIHDIGNTSDAGPIVALVGE